ncbi:VanZ family protein [Roseovarius sp. D22-M7]|uniref:VanZ family protein n=1 Tax=Roseovarius sp. D22-M7 TaxID=3127116 RepID=UPI00300F992D
MAHVLTLALAVTIAVLTLGPVPQGPPGVPQSDKLGHILAFAALAAPMAWRHPKSWFFVALAATGYGALIEVVQPLVGRALEVADLLADALGAFFGAWMVALVQRFRRMT